MDEGVNKSFCQRADQLKQKKKKEKERKKRKKQLTSTAKFRVALIRDGGLSFLSR